MKLEVQEVRGRYEKQELVTLVLKTELASTEQYYLFGLHG